MKKIKEIVVVEGKTDTALLKELFEVDTIETHGLALDQQTLELIQEASKSRGIIVLTDPDFPGKKFMSIQAVVPNCQHAFVAKRMLEVRRN
ncbi:MAG: toprim domain-containing protein [Thomasclavelia ramosa]